MEKRRWWISWPAEKKILQRELPKVSSIDMKFLLVPTIQKKASGGALEERSGTRHEGHVPSK